MMSFGARLVVVVLMLAWDAAGGEGGRRDKGGGLQGGGREAGVRAAKHRAGRPEQQSPIFPLRRTWGGAVDVVRDALRGGAVERCWATLEIAN